MDKIKNIFITVTVGFFILTLLNSCHKFSEDPFISLKSPYARLHSGNWKFTSYQIYGVEHSHDFDNLLTPNTLTDCSASFVDSRSDYPFFISNGKSFIVYGQFEISSDNKTLMVTETDSTVFFIKVFHPTKITSQYLQSPNWTIVELYGKKLHISNNGIDIYFKKQ